VHHVVPFRLFPSADQANRLSNLTSLCPSCHKSLEVDGHSRYPLFGNGASDRLW
jgi:DEAD/DEAH box helicase domain-containing protein